MDELIAFLRAYPPFDRLPSAAVEFAAANLQSETFVAGVDLLRHGGEPAQCLSILGAGYVDLLRETEGEPLVYERLGLGEAFGYPSLLRGGPPVVTVRTATDGMRYCLPAAIFHQLRAEYDVFARYFATSALEWLSFAAQHRYGEAEPGLFQTPLRALIRRDLVVVHPETRIGEAARLMAEQHISCLLVDLPPYGVLDSGTGMITDRDLRNRVLATELSADRPVREIMSHPTISLSGEHMVFEGLLMMLERGIHHLAITEADRVIGIVTHTDVLRRQSKSPLFLPKQLERARDLDDLRHYGDQVAKTVGGLLERGVRVADIGRVVAVAHDALLQRLLRDAEAELGPPPAPYAWLVLGSEGRFEQTLRTDQDNALIYADEHPPEAPAYFETLAELVVERLVLCGFPRCTGEVMAVNPRWRQPLETWQDTFANWIGVPNEEALLRAGIFFDYRQAYGTLDAEAALRPILLQARSNTIFLARLARAALRAEPPLNFFGKVTPERRGEHKDRLDLKHRGTALIVDLARIFALQAGRTETSTTARLRMAWPEASISEVEAHALIGAFDLLSQLRLRHQLAQLAQGETPNNLIHYPSLSPLEQRELRAAFQTIGRVQRALAMSFQTDRLGG
ncbi:MAG: DUF294 nucleotidyltransferase-like domain-containing protein [Oscillochloridaceae bacterium umkhey_bin13]